MARAIMVLAIWAACGGAAAQTIYKCTADGKVSYGEQPCLAGDQATLAAPPAPPVDTATRERLARQKALVETLETERRDAQARHARTAARAAGGEKRAGNGARQQRCDKLRLQLKWLEEDLRQTAGPQTEPLKRKIRRHTESMAVECQP